MGLCHFWPAQYSPASVNLSFVRWFDLFGSSNNKFLYANSCAIYCFQVKTSFQDRVIASILGKSNDVAFKISVYEPSFYSIYFAVTLHDSKISFLFCHLSAYHMIVNGKDL